MTGLSLNKSSKLSVNLHECMHTSINACKSDISIAVEQQKSTPEFHAHFKRMKYVRPFSFRVDGIWLRVSVRNWDNCRFVTAVLQFFMFLDECSDFVLCFCWIKALLAHSCHCRIMWCRIEDDIDPGRNGRRPGEPIPYRSGQGEPPVHMALYPTAAGQWRPPPRGGWLEVCLLSDGRRPPGPDYIGRWGWRMTFEEGNKRDRFCLERASSSYFICRYRYAQFTAT